MISGSVGTQFASMIFVILTLSMGLEDFCVSLELGSGDDFWVGCDTVFVNDL